MSWDPLAEAEEQQQPKIEVVLENARFPGGKLEFVLERVGEVGISSAEDYIQRMIQTHVTGDDVENEPAVPFQHKGKSYRLNRPIIRNITYLLVMQRQQPKYDFAFFLGLAKNFSDEFQQLRRKAWLLQEPLRPRIGEESLNPFASPEDDGEDGSFDALLTSDNGTSTSKRGRTKTSAASPTP